MSKPDVANFVRKARLSVAKHAPEILTGMGIAGMITTTVLAVRATPKALRLIEEEKQEQQVDELPAVQTIKATWKCYIPAAVTGLTSIMCLICASSVNAKRYAALTTAYKLSETALTDYKSKVIETIGEKKEKTVREKVDKEHIEQNPVSRSEIIITDKGNTLCFDPISGRYFKSDIDRIKRAENAINKTLLHGIAGYASLNEFYDELDLDHTSMGDVLGWNTNRLVDIDFTSQIADDGTPCIVIDYREAPIYDYASFV